MHINGLNLRRLISCIILLCLLPLASSAAESNENDSLGFEVKGKSVSYSEKYNRYVNNYTRYPASRADDVIAMFNRAFDAMESPVPVYLYFVESSRSHPMTVEFDETSDFYRHLCDELHVDGHDHLKFSTFEQFCEYFYSTDHHWNHRGSYQGYVDIVHMLLGEDEEVLVPEEEVTLPVIFNGSLAKNQKRSVSTEHFSLYRFSNLQPYTCYANGRRRKYDNVQLYLEGRCSDDKFANHYQLCYGGEFALAVFETGLTDKPNLLMFSDSMGAGVKYLLASHFNRIVCVDLRYYREEFKRSLSLREVVKEYDIDMILLLGECQFFVDAKNLIP